MVFTPTLLPTAAVGAFTLLVVVWAMFAKKKWDPRGKHCYVTGGSAGLGLSLAILLTKKGADVSIVARDGERLRKALEQLENSRQTPNQVLRMYSFSLHDAASSAAALEAASVGNGGKCPDAVFLCAGASRPGFFVEQDEASLRLGMDNGYWVQAWSALAAAKRMARDKFPGKIVFVSSLLGYMSMVGYSSYSPAKHALRGLAETLRSELLLYTVSVHIFFPGTIYSPGYVEENKTKPKITLKIEESDEGLEPDRAAEGLLHGVQKGHFHISGDLLGNIFRASTRGASPFNNVFLDAIYGFFGWTHNSQAPWLTSSPAPEILPPATLVTIIQLGHVCALVGVVNLFVLTAARSHLHGNPAVQERIVFALLAPLVIGDFLHLYVTLWALGDQRWEFWNWSPMLWATMLLGLTLMIPRIAWHLGIGRYVHSRDGALGKS
ncbi:hypothetical protein D9615_000466 [Tricholomella constricta]|uniref:3-dehydrosphinganine reductase n=1 Tax=Tricholomella constricta TaxID=117010 RepID=A0A8H5HRF4_9AGAR|nr:hypothetical protein D9615_000466 [Tricholomella constricta]